MNTIIRNLLLSAIVVGGLCSCGSKASGPSPLVAQSERIAGELGAVAEASPMFLQSVEVDYADATLGVDVAFSDTTVNVSDYSEALVQYVLAQYMKSHLGANLDEVINTLIKEKGALKITLTDYKGTSREYPVTPARMKQLLKLKPMELNYNDVRTNVSDILASRCETYKNEYNAEAAEFSIYAGFAQYTLTFPRATAYASLNQASLTGRYLKKLKERYENYGACAYMIEELLQSLQIDGYRFVYTDEKDTKTLRAAVPWKLID